MVIESAAVSVTGDVKSPLITVGKVTGVFGIKGWLKIASSTEPSDNILKYSPLWLKTRHGVKLVEFDSTAPRGQHFIVHVGGVDTPEEAANYVGSDIAVRENQLKPLHGGDFYWRQLIGLKVVTAYAGESQDLGVVGSLLETGANDVLVVDHTESSIDERQRLVPYVLEMYIQSVDLELGQITVIWDPEF
ncbi:MAG: ribosome maturation factor RimM [Alteromonadaceae bacterium]|nr:MAG: ribosome maturation factor RimM [Alteromonadaceae bacterium]